MGAKSALPAPLHLDTCNTGSIEATSQSREIYEWVKLNNELRTGADRRLQQTEDCNSLIAAERAAIDTTK